jgi:lanthanide-dependent methanol dehydrogenase
MRSRWLLSGVAAAGMLAMAGGVQANEGLLVMEGNPSYWPTQLGNYAGQRYSRLGQINKSNVKDLRVAWTFSTGVLRGHEGGPLVIGDVMYIHTPFPNIVYALDLNDQGRVIWRYQPDQDPTVIPVMCCDTVNRGVAYGDGKIVLYQADTNLVALDARTGEELWKTANGDPGIGETGTMSPLIVGDKVIVGISGGEFGVQGHMSAYDLNSGEMVWRAYSVGTDDQILMDPENTTHLGQPVGADSGTNTWEGEQWKLGGGTTWGWVTYDPELHLIYYGSGNPGTWNPNQRPGDNRWSMTIMARDPDTGMAKWVYQKTPHDEWDYDGVNENILAELDFDGEMRKVLVNFDRNGFAYTLDRETGELLVAEKYDPAVNWATHVDMETGRPQVVPRYSTAHQGEDVNTTNICPAALGTKDQQPATFSPRTGLFYVPTNHVCMDYEPYAVSYTAGQPYVGATLSMYPAPGGDHLGNFIAWDAVKGEIVWSNPEPFSVWSGALSTAGDVVFYGTLEGHLKAVDAHTGQELYSFKTPSGIIGNVNTYMHRGKQHVAVLSGIGGWAGIGLAAGLTGDTEGLGAVGAYKALSDYTQLGGVLTVFTLPD